MNKARKPNFLIVDKNTGVAEIEEAFRTFCARDDIAIILINQHVAEMIRYQVDQHLASIPAVLGPIFFIRPFPIVFLRDSIQRNAL